MVCIASSPWSTLPHRTQQLMFHMKGVEILYFSPFHDHIRKSPQQKRKVCPHITTYILPKSSKKIANTAILFSLRQKRVAQFISRTMAKHHMRNPLLWVTHPSQEEITCHLNYSTLIYDCFEPWQEEYLVAQEYLMRKADLIFVASPQLKKQVREYNRNVALLYNGVNYGVFEEASLFSRLDPLEKRFGFAGVIDYDLDLSPLIYVAKQKSQWQFMLLGPCPQGNPYLERLKPLKNVEFYGEHSMHVVPEFLFSCHVLMDFRYRNRPNYDINPLRLYDYFATGRPIVGQSWQEEVERFPDVVYMSSNQEGYLKNCQLALKENSEEAVIRRKNYAKKGSWRKRAEQIMKMLSASGLG